MQKKRKHLNEKITQNKNKRRGYRNVCSHQTHRRSLHTGHNLKQKLFHSFDFPVSMPRYADALISMNTTDRGTGKYP